MPVWQLKPLAEYEFSLGLVFSLSIWTLKMFLINKYYSIDNINRY